MNEEYSQSFFLPKLLKDSDDMVFADQLLTKTLLNNKKFEEEIQIHRSSSQCDPGNALTEAHRIRKAEADWWIWNSKKIN